MQQLNPAAFARMLENFSEPALYRPAFACPCINPSSGSARANCLHCNGQGWLWSAPQQINIAVASSSVQQAWAKMGSYESGDLVLSIPNTSPAYEIAPFHRVTMLANTDEKSAPLTRGAPRERLLGPIKSIRRVFWINALNAVVEGAIPAVNEDGTLGWPAVGAPPAGQQYSITWVRYLEYFAFTQFANDRMKHNLPLPRRMVLRRFDLMGRVTGSKQV